MRLQNILTRDSRFVFCLLFLVLPLPFFGQDSVVFDQAKAALFSNTYTFIRKDKADAYGTFLQRSGTDDLQYWYGHGTFSETKHKIELLFDSTGEHNRIVQTASGLHDDTLYIHWFDWWGQEQVWFNVRTDAGTKKYSCDDFSGLVKIPRAAVNDSLLCLCPFNSNQKLYTFQVADSTNEINLFVNAPTFMHTFGKRKETLKKNKSGFKTTGMWTNGKSIQFVSRKKKQP